MKSGGIASIFKFFLSLFFVPVVAAVIFSFVEELAKIGTPYNFFLSGMFSYVVFHLFIFSPDSLYQSGQRVFADIFGFFPKLASPSKEKMLITPGVMRFT